MIFLKHVRNNAKRVCIYSKQRWSGTLVTDGGQSYESRETRSQIAWNARAVTDKGRIDKVTNSDRVTVLNNNNIKLIKYI